MGAEEIMFSLLRSGVCKSELQVDMIKNLSMKEYSELYHLSKKHDLSHIVAWVLDQKGILGKDQISAEFYKQLMLSIYRSDQRKCALEQIGCFFEESQIAYIPLKGSILCNYYPEEWLRTSCDIDVLIHKEDTEKAIQILCNAGFVKKNDETTHDHSLISPRGVHLELHYNLISEDKFLEANHMLEKVWDYVTLDNVNSHRYSMTNEMFMLYHIVHMAKHFLHGGCGIRSFIDLWLLENNMPYDFSKLKGMLEEARLLEFYNESRGLCGVWMEGHTHSKLTEQMEQFVLSGGTYGNRKNSARVRAAKGEGKIHNVKNLVFVSRVNLEMIYPNLKRKPFLFPFYQIKRWFRILRKDKRNKMLSFINARNSVLQNEESDTARLLEQLGLI